ncbi:hypothetical protein ACFQZ4_44850 [Catellatospora coxensis]
MLALTGFALAVFLFATGAPGGGFLAAVGAVLALATVGDFAGSGDRPD